MLSSRQRMVEVDMGTYDTISGTPRNDPMFDSDPPCEICGKHIDECKCPPCPECGAVGCTEHKKKMEESA